MTHFWLYYCENIIPGTWQATDEAELDKAMRTALDIGYRYFDTAALYRNEHIIGKILEEYIKNGKIKPALYRNEHIIGKILEEYIKDGKIKREDIYITTKLPLTGHDDPGKWIEESLKNLRTDYIDFGKGKPVLIPHIETWRGLEKYYKEGKLKAIGISNFNIEQIQELYNQAEIKPMNNQVECHILHPQKELYDFCKKLNITLTAYAPIGSPGRPDAVRNGVKQEENPLEHPITVKLSKKYNKTPAQILIRQMIQRGISTIPKSTNEKRLKENFDVFDFELTKEEMDEFNTIKDDKQLFLFDFVKDHPYHPWKDALKKRGLI
uniref:NADP-dependent oxidoreductase domain-containing protein n=1 Tax=Panagrolaimus sp. JU765 TaxID=591449 RepID=A0AC34R2U3_9BILA